MKKNYERLEIGRDVIFSQKSMSKLWLAGLLFLITTFAHMVSAQVSTGYAFSQSTIAYTPLATPTALFTTAWDDNQNNFTMPFSYTFNGASSTSVRISSNGFVTFGTNPGTTNYNPISSLTGYTGAISAFGRDLVNNGATMSTGIEGSAPNRVFVIQWNNARRYNGGAAVTGDVLNFQIRLYETTNKAEVRYGNCSATSGTALTAEVGLRGSSNADFNNRTSATNWSSTTAGASNAATITSSNTIMPSSGLTFTWTPVPSYCSASAVNTGFEKISNVSFNTINNNSSSTAGYESFTGVSTTVSRTVTYAFSTTISGGFAADQTVVFIDWNQDLDFTDPGETVFTSATSVGPHSTNITIPATASLGNTRMRVRLHDTSDGPNATSCGTSTYGQVEDYTLSIVAPPACAPVTNLVVSGLNPTGATLSWTAATGTPVSYQWEIRTSGAGGSGGAGLADSNTVTAPTVTASSTALSPSTTYTAYVRTFCGGSDFSTWTASAIFTTPCLPTTVLPSVEGFEAGAPCWTVSAISGNNWATYTSVLTTEVPGPHSGSLLAGIAWVSGVSSDALLISPPYNISANGNTQAQVKIWIYRANDGVASDRISVIVNSSPTHTGGATILDVPRLRTLAPTAAAAGWHEYVANVPLSFNSGTFYVLARGVVNGTFSNYSVGLDDFTLEFAPSTIFSFSPGTICASGSDAQRTITINGSNFIGATGVSVNGTAAQSFTVDSANQITAVVSASSTTGNVSVTGPGGSVSSTGTLSIYQDYPFYADNDGDSFGSGPVVNLCAVNGATAPAGYSVNNTDCDDTDNTKNAMFAFFTDADGDGFGAGSSSMQCAVDANTAPAGYSVNNTDCDDADNTKNAMFAFFTDGDADGFGAGSSSMQCAVDANTPPSGYSVNNTDCDDADNTKNAMFAFFTDGDGDGFGAGSSSMQCAVDANTPPSGYSINDTDCDDTDNTKNAMFAFFTDGDGDGFGAGSSSMQCAVNASTPPAGYSLTNTDCNDGNANIYPSSPEIGYNLIDDDCDGLTDEGFPIKATVPAAATCGTILTAIDQTIYAGLVSGAQGYQWRVTTISGPGAGQVQLLNTPLRQMKLTQLANYAYGSTYKLEVAVYMQASNGQGVFLQPYTATTCNVSTPTALTQLTNCAQTLVSMNDVIYANAVSFTSGYRFKITDPLSPSNTQTIDRTVREFRMNLITNFTVQYNKTYQVEVAVRNTDGSYLPFGSVCNVTTPIFPTTGLQDAQCDNGVGGPYAVPSMSTQIYATSYPGATAYAFRLTGSGLPAAGIEVTKTLRVFTLNDFAGMGIVPGTTYNVNVRLIFNASDPVGQYGKTCSLTVPGGSRIKTVDFDADAYPNPFAESFNIDLTTSLNDKVGIRIYDMTGRLLEEMTSTVSEAELMNIGNRYPAGVYNIIVTQGNEVKTLRVIKR